MKHVASHLLWLVDSLVGLWLVYIGRNTWLAIFQRYYVPGSLARAARATLFDRILSIVFGVAWFLMVIISESYLDKGVEKGDLMRRFGKATGPIVLALFVVDVVLAFVQGVANTGLLRWLIILVELVLGVALVWLGWTRKVAAKQEQKISGVN